MHSESPLTGSDLRGTYEPTTKSLAVGQGESEGLILYDSHTWLRQAGAGLGTNLGSVSGASRAAGRRATVLTVAGLIYIEPTAWAIGNAINLGWRIIRAEQDIQSGAVILDATYTMWLNGAFGMGPAASANDAHTNMREGRFMRTFSTSNSNTSFNVPIFWRGKCTLADRECLALYLELEASGGAVGLRYQTWIRSLVQD